MFECTHVCLNKLPVPALNPVAPQQNPKTSISFPSKWEIFWPSETSIKSTYYEIADYRRSPLVPGWLPSCRSGKDVHSTGLPDHISRQFQTMAAQVSHDKNQNQVSEKCTCQEPDLGPDSAEMDVARFVQRLPLHAPSLRDLPPCTRGPGPMDHSLTSSPVYFQEQLPDCTRPWNVFTECTISSNDRKSPDYNNNCFKSVLSLSRESCHEFQQAALLLSTAILSCAKC